MTGAIIRRVAVCAAIVGMMLIPQIASAQSGAVRGKVVDAQGNPVEGAQVEITSLDMGGKPLLAKTKKDGTYMHVGLTPGGYKITVSKGDLSTGIDNVHIGLDMKEQNFTLAAAAKGGGGNKPNPKLAAAQKAFDDAVQLSNADDMAKYDEAVAKFGEAATAMAPTPCGECYSNIGTVELKQAAKLQGDDQKKKLDEAEASFKKAIEAKPDLADAYNGLANLYNAEKKFDQASEASKKAMELATASGGAGAAAGGAAAAGPSPSAVYNQGVILWNAGKIPEAKAQFEQAVKLDPNNADAHYWLGMALVNGGDTKGAKPEFETYLKLAPNGANAATAKAVLDSIK